MPAVGAIVRNEIAIAAREQMIRREGIAGTFA
jgi:hypothetical protein